MATTLTVPKLTKQVHFLYGITGHAVISALCGAAIQRGEGEWDNNVNYWGRVGIKRHRPITHLTLDPNAVTCGRCLPLVPKVREGKANG